MRWKTNVADLRLLTVKRFEYRKWLIVLNWIDKLINGLLDGLHRFNATTLTAEWWCCSCDSWWLLWLPTLLLLLLWKIEPGCGAGRLWWRAGAVGGISCACRNHGSPPLVTVDGCEKPRWWPTTTDWCPDVCKFTAWLFITSSEPVEFLLRKIFLRYFR